MMMKLLSEDKLEVGRHVTLAVKRSEDAQEVIVYLALSRSFLGIRIDIAPPLILSPFKLFKGEQRFEDAMQEYKTPEARAALEYVKILWK